MFVLKGKGTFRHLGYADRIKIEALRKTGTCVKEIAAYIGCSVSTVRFLLNCLTELLNENHLFTVLHRAEVQVF